MKRFCTFFLILALGTLTGCQAIDHYQARNDFNEICNVIKEFAAKPNENLASQATRLSIEISKVIDSNAAFTSMQALALADRNDKYNFFLEAAKQVGLKDFRCPAYEQRLNFTE